MTTEQPRRQSSKFQPGQSGNPAGRPKGSRHKVLVALDSLAEGEADAIARAMIEKAKEGDAVAGKAILDRVWPVRKGARVSFNLPPVSSAEQLPAAIADIAGQVAAGDISPDEGGLIVALLDAQRRAIETSELATRIAALEERIAK